MKNLTKSPSGRMLDFTMMGALAGDRGVSRVSRLAVATLVVNLGIILWGALVRATGSGAGCGNHWPLCNGEVEPGMGAIHHGIELTHRITVGIGLGLVVWLWATVRIWFHKGHPARLGANLSVLFTLSESLIGAGLVLFKLVAHNDSAYRAVAVSAHLVNTFLLVASLTLTCWWVAGNAPLKLSGQGAVGWLLAAALVGAVVVGVTGAVTALGDTLFPPVSRQEIGSQVSATAHFLIRLRVYHPAAAVSAGVFAALTAWLVAGLRPSPPARAAAYWVRVLVVVQIGAGFLNLLLLAPLAMQLAHLLLADALWIGLVLLAASALAEGSPRAIRVEAETRMVEGAS